jgi:SAM-dependent methyltransferase
MEVPVQGDLPSKRSKPSQSPPLDDSPRTGASKRSKATSRPPPPPYGSLEYWDNRYRKQFQTVNAALEGGPAAARKESKEDEAASEPHHQRPVETLPFHNWYFSYDELRVLILPLILGGRKEAFSILADESGPESGPASDSENDSSAGEKDDANWHSPSPSEGADRAESEFPSEPSSASQTMKVQPADDKASDDPHSSDAEDDGEEIDRDGTGGDDDESDEEDVDREGLARDGPISVLEIGCGDVPLCAGLLTELVKLSKVTGVSHQAIVNRLLATDYSSVVIDAMKKKHSCEEGKVGVLEFEAVDARALPYADRSFNLVLEKGVLDAMLSDSTEGTENCVQIVRECGRVLSVGGILVLVSHLNANTPNGVRWVENVVLAGLSDKDGESKAAWEIEVHGGDGNESCDGSDESVDSLSPGPAVYILHKRERADDAPATQALELKFFVY